MGSLLSRTLGYAVAGCIRIVAGEDAAVRWWRKHYDRG